MKKSKAFLSDVPNAFSTVDGVYKSPREMEISLKALLKILGRGSAANGDIPSYRSYHK